MCLVVPVRVSGDGDASLGFGVCVREIANEVV